MKQGEKRLELIDFYTYHESFNLHTYANTAKSSYIHPTKILYEMSICYAVLKLGDSIVMKS